MNTSFSTVILEGFLATVVLIVAIGSQNIYVLKCSMRNYFPFYVGLACFAGDVVLMSLGIFGLGKIVSQSKLLLNVMCWTGVCFLVGYGCFSLCRVFSIQKKFMFIGQLNDAHSDSQNTSLWKAVIMALSFTFLNPHVYIDTVLIVGNLGTRYPSEQQVFFICGCLLASASWFFLLSVTGKIFSRVLTNARVWQGLEFLIACIMFYLSWRLLHEIL